jgi:predicted membrane GTPase involved in stress response
MISTKTGKATGYALEGLQGQIVGEHCRDNDLPVNAASARRS